MNLLLVSHDFSVTGAPNSLLRQAIYFRDAGHSVDIWSLGDGGLKPRYLEAGFNPIIINNSYEDIKQQYEKTNKKYDLIVCNTTVTYKAVDVLQHYNTPVVWFIRETKLVDDGIHNSSEFAEIFRNFYNIYTVSRYAANVSKKYNKHVRVINNGIVDSFKDFKKQEKTIVFGFIGSIISIKGIDVLIAAFNKLAKDNKNVELHIAGSYSHEYGENLRQQSCSAIKWLGETQGADKQKFFDSIDILVVPSIDDPCPLTVIEGAMLGKPIITTDTVGSNYMVNNKNGFIVKTGDVNDLYESMDKIIKKDLLKMSKRSRRMYFKYGTADKERKCVLKMLKDNIGNVPVIKHDVNVTKYDLRIPLIRYRKYINEIKFSVLGMQIFKIKNTGKDWILYLFGMQMFKKHVSHGYAKINIFGIRVFKYKI